ncbi:hypothetical protein [Hyphobacterium sp.]|jgi:hypothetical protein
MLTVATDAISTACDGRELTGQTASISFRRRLPDYLYSPDLPEVIE